MKYNLSTLSYVLCAFYVLPMISLPIQWLKRFPPRFSARSFTVLAFAHRPVTPFELICEYGVRLKVKVYCFPCGGYPLVPAPFVEKSILYPLSFLLQINWSNMWGPISGLYCIPLIYTLYLYANTTQSWLLQLYSKSWNQIL